MMKIMQLMAAVILWCGVSGGCVAEEMISPVLLKTTEPTNLRQYERTNTGHEGKMSYLCADFLEVLNTIPFEVIYQDIFLDMLKERGDFDTAGFKYIEDGEKLYGDMALKRIEIEEAVQQIGQEYTRCLTDPANKEDVNVCKKYSDQIEDGNFYPENKSDKLIGRIEGIKKLKEQAGGFDYYLVYADVFEDGTELPVIFYKSRLPQNDVDKREYFNHVVMEKDLKGPNKREYRRMGGGMSSDAGQLFKYRDNVYQLHFISERHASILKLDRDVEACGYNMINKFQGENQKQ